MAYFKNSTKCSRSSKHTPWDATCSISRTGIGDIWQYCSMLDHVGMFLFPPVAAKWLCGLLQLPSQGAQKHLLGWNDGLVSGCFWDTRAWHARGMLINRRCVCLHCNICAVCPENVKAHLCSQGAYSWIDLSHVHTCLALILWAVQKQAIDTLQPWTTCGEWSDVMSTRLNGQISRACKSIMIYHDISWYFMIYHDISWFWIMMYLISDVWWFTVHHCQ